MRFPRTKCIKSIWERRRGRAAGETGVCLSVLGFVLFGQLAVVFLHQLYDMVQEFVRGDAERSRIFGYLERAQEAVTVFNLAYERPLNAELGANVNLTGRIESYTSLFCVTCSSLKIICS